jgi:hypothetical protein
MKRLSLAFAAAFACLLVASVGTASAMPTEGIVSSECSVTNNHVAGRKLTTTVSGKNVAASQMKYAECKIVKKVLNTVIKREVERPQAIEGFRITPSIVSETPLTINYTGLFRGADTATEIRLKFKITYANN